VDLQQQTEGEQGMLPQLRGSDGGGGGNPDRHQDQQTPLPQLAQPRRIAAHASPPPRHLNGAHGLAETTPAQPFAEISVRLRNGGNPYPTS
jgi:hypothetical protein